MNIGSISGNPYQTQWGNDIAQRQVQLQQLGQDLSSGNTAAAKADFVNLTKALSSLGQTSGTNASQTPVAQEFEKLGEDMQAGDTSAAQVDYAQIQRSMQQAHMHAQHPSNHVEENRGSNSTHPADLLRLLTNTATVAASAYGSAGLTAVNMGSSLLSALA